MPSPYNTLRSKLNRAVAAYLVQQGNACGGANDIGPANTRQSKGYPNTTIRSTLAKAEVMGTGIERINFQIEVKGSATQDPSVQDVDNPRVQFDARCAATKDAMMQTLTGQNLRATAVSISAAGRSLAVSDGTIQGNQVAADNSDMVDFTCQEIFDIGEGDGQADAAGCDWEEIFLFEAICSASNVD